MLRSYRGASPRIAPSAYVDPGATVIGDVAIGERSSVWPSASIRGDISPIRIGAETNIQDGCVLHSDEGIPLTLGDRVTVGHSVVLHGCTIADDAVIGIGAIILNSARIGIGAVVAAGALVPEGMEIPPGMLAMGMPAKLRRPVTSDEQERFREGVRNYTARAAAYQEQA